MKAALSVFAVALLSGGVVRWVSGTGNSGTASPVEARPVTASASEPRESVAPTAAGLIEDTRRKIKDATVTYLNPYHAELATWTDEEIRAALDESLKNRDFLLDTRRARSLASALLAEWMKRDWAAASEWFVKMPGALRSEDMTLRFSAAWPAHHAAEGLAFVKANPLVFENAHPWAIAMKNIEARAKEGPASVISLLDELRDAKIGVPYEDAVSFPPNFDFAVLMASPEVAALLKEGRGKFFTGAWFEQDRDGCFDWVMRNGGAGALSDMVAVSEVEDPTDGLRWLGSRYGTLKTEDRETFIQGFPVGYPPVIAAVTAGIDNTGLADDLRSACAVWISKGETPGALDVLETIQDPARRIKTLEEFDRSKAGNAPPISAGDAEVLRKRLLDWNASPGQVEAIMNKFLQRR